MSFGKYLLPTAWGDGKHSCADLVSGRHGVAQLWPLRLVSGLWPVTGCLPENECESHRASLASRGQREPCTAILKQRAVHLVHGLPLTRTNRAHLTRGHSPNKPRYTSRVAFRLKRKGDKRVLHAPTVKTAHNSGGRGQPPAHSCHCGDSFETELGGGAQVHIHVHVHTLQHRYTHHYAEVFTFACTHRDTNTHIHTNICTKSHTFMHVHCHTCAHKCKHTYMVDMNRNKHTLTHACSHTQTTHQHWHTYMPALSSQIYTHTIILTHTHSCPTAHPHKHPYTHLLMQIHGPAPRSCKCAQSHHTDTHACTAPTHIHKCGVSGSFESFCHLQSGGCLHPWGADLGPSCPHVPADAYRSLGQKRFLLSPSRVLGMKDNDFCGTSQTNRVPQVDSPWLVETSWSGSWTLRS